MPHIILFDNEVRDRLLPLTFTRPVCEIRFGVLSIREKWAQWLGAPVSYVTQDYLAGRYEIGHGEENLIINGSVCPSPQLVRLLQQMDYNEAFLKGDELIAAKLKEEDIERLIADDDIGELKGYELTDTAYLKLDHLWDIYRLNAQAIAEDVELLTKNRSSAALHESNRVVGPRERLFLEEGAQADCAVFNTTGGPIYIGKDARVMEGSLLRGPVALGAHSTFKMGAKIYGGTTVGPHCKVGGEVSNSVFLGYSNKAHDGYLGNSVIGQWCNIGADTNNSNLKNNYDEVRLWSYPKGRFAKTGQQFCGLFMGDHSKTAINTSLNTGTVVGVSVNLFGEGFPRNFVPSFSWGGKNGFQTYRMDRAFETMERVMARRGIDLDVRERLTMLRVFEDTVKYRSWEK